MAERSGGFVAFAATNLSQQIMADNPRRKGWTIKNISGGIVYVANDLRFTVNIGFPLDPGEFLTFLDMEGDPVEMAVYVQTAAPTVLLRYHEAFEL